MLTEVVQPQPKNNSNSETDLGALAEHLSVIADALRQSTGSVPHSENTTLNKDARALAEVSSELTKTLAANSALTDTATIKDDSSDRKMRRRQFSALAREAYAVRRRRSVIFKSEELFGEPAWDILLDLYIAQIESKPVSVSSACIGSAAPPTTGLRWLGVLAEHELILREHDPEDQRRVLVRLTEKALNAMDSYFAGVTRAL